MADSSSDRYLTAQDLAQRFRVSRARAYELMRELPRLAIGRSVRVSEKALLAWEQRHTRPPAEGVRVAAPRRELRLPVAADDTPIRLTQPRTKPRTFGERGAHG
ncbi:MAG: helix-turn-helix domain-containing protein [Myxococcales bacterium]|nr:helix-turn-helix domain-containing protein [Myxococcales bacterium]